MEIDTGNHPPPIASKPYTLPLKHYEWVQREIETLEHAGIIERMGITSSHCLQEKCSR